MSLQHLQYMAQNETDLRHIFRVVEHAGGVDLTRYKPATIRRRLGRRMQMQRVFTLREYLQVLHENTDEIDALCEEVLITYTRFFRDENAFNVLQAHIIPEIYRQLPKNTAARVWIPGCRQRRGLHRNLLC